MKQQSIDLRNEFQPAEEEIFFDEETVQRIPAVVPLDETPTRTSARRFRKLRVPMRKADNSFNPAFLIMALVAVTALGVIAGTLVYRTTTEKSTNATINTDEPVNRTIPAQYQFVVDKPESTETRDSLNKNNFTSDKDNFTSLPSDDATTKKDSGENRESTAPEGENEQQPTEKEETVEETEPSVTSEETEEPPPPPPSIRRKENKKQGKDKPKNDNAKSETQEEAPPREESEESIEN